MIDNYKVGNRIALLRKEMGLTGEKFAEALGVSPQAVSKWENGKCLPESALLPEIAALFGTTIDSILMPQELVILDARYTCGSSSIVVTDTLNRSVEGNRLYYRAECPIGGQSVEGPAVFVLTVKYKTPDGTYYAYAPQGEALRLDLSSKGFTTASDLQIIGAYYGTGKEYRSVMDKMKHYEYFKWKEIHVNHESFPSSPGCDESEYLTLVYMNASGLHVIGCEENGVLCYNENHTELYVKDTSRCMLSDVEVLEWGANNTMPCTWAGALYAALKSMGETYTYEKIMGMSGACYRIAFCDVWDWSALDALVAYSYDMPLYEAIGYKPVWACRLEKDDRIAERRKIVADILSGKPVLAINLRVAAEWGVITGYSDNGKKLYCRTYFDNDRLNENKDYLETDNWPFLITHFGERCDKPSDVEILKNSLHALVDSFEAPPRDGYYQGKQGYERWIAGLRNDQIWSEQCPPDELARRFDVHLSTVYQLVDARKCAAAYLTECCAIVDSDVAVLLKEMADTYQRFADSVDQFKEGLLTAGVSSFTNPANGRTTRGEQAVLLESALRDDTENVKKANGIIDRLNESNHKMQYAICKTFENGDDDTEMQRYKVLAGKTCLIPESMYDFDSEKKSIIFEDLGKDDDYICGSHYDEDNISGEFIRQNYSAIIKAAAEWHASFWENIDLFGQIGLDWRFQTKENLLSHISMMEKDFNEYRKAEESGNVPKAWEDEFDGISFRFENNISAEQLDCFEDALDRLKGCYWESVGSRFHTGKNITVIHGDLNPCAIYIPKTADKTVKFTHLQAVRMGLPTEDLAMLLALHIEPEKAAVMPLLDEYYNLLSKNVNGYPYELFMSDYKIALMENMFFTIRLINRGIYDFKMRDKAIRAFETVIYPSSTEPFQAPR